MKVMTQWATNGQIPVAYQVKGSGIPMVLLHGYLESKEIWKEFTPALILDSQVFTIDLPGHGQTPPTGDISTMDLMGEAVLAVLDHHGIDRAVMVGHSMEDMQRCLSWNTTLRGCLGWCCCTVILSRTVWRW